MVLFSSLGRANPPEPEYAVDNRQLGAKIFIEDEVCFELVIWQSIVAGSS